MKMKKLFYTMAIILSSSTFAFASNSFTTEIMEINPNSNFEYDSSHDARGCYLFMTYTDALGNESSWTEYLGETDTRDQCLIMAETRFLEIAMADPCGNGLC